MKIVSIRYNESIMNIANIQNTSHARKKEKKAKLNALLLESSKHWTRNTEDNMVGWKRDGLWHADERKRWQCESPSL